MTTRTMTQKHYEAFIYAITTSPALNRHYRAVCAGVIADVCEADSPRFQRERFMKACVGGVVSS